MKRERSERKAPKEKTKAWESIEYLVRVEQHKWVEETYLQNFQTSHFFALHISCVVESYLCMTTLWIFQKLEQYFINGCFKKMLIPKCRRLNFLEPWKVVSALVLLNAPSEIGRLFFFAASPWTQPSSNICTCLFEDLSDDHVAHPFKGHTRAHLTQLGLAFSWPSFNPWLYSKFS